MQITNPWIARHEQYTGFRRIFEFDIVYYRPLNISTPKENVIRITWKIVALYRYFIVIPNHCKNHYATFEIDRTTLICLNKEWEVYSKDVHTNQNVENFSSGTFQFPANFLIRDCSFFLLLFNFLRKYQRAEYLNQLPLPLPLPLQIWIF